MDAPCNASHCITVAAQDPPEKQGFWEKLWFVPKASHIIITLKAESSCNRSVWKTLCLVTCGFFGLNILQRLVGILEACLDRKARCKYCQG